MQGVPILIFANKQDLPGAKEPKELEKLLGLHELSPLCPPQQLTSSASVPVSNTTLSSLGTGGNISTNINISTTPTATATSTSTTISTTSSTIPNLTSPVIPTNSNNISSSSSSSSSGSSNNATNVHQNTFKGWYIQPACAITGDGLQEGLEALYDMIIKRRKLNKAHKKKRN